MARGYMYNIVENPCDLGLSEGDLYECLGWLLVDNVKDEPEEIAQCMAKNFAWMLQRFGAEVNATDKYAEIVFPEGFKERWFQEKYIELCRKVQEMSLYNFSCDTMKVRELKRTIDNTYGDAIYNEFGVVFSLDSFIRDIAYYKKYYLGYDVVLMH